MRHALCSIVLSILLHSTALAQQAESSNAATPYIINIPETLRTEWQQVAAKAILNDIYGQLGIAPEYVFYPTRRALKLLNEGVIDAEAGRLAGLEAQFPDLRRIPNKLIELQVGVFCLAGQHCALTGQLNYALKQGFMLGEGICEQRNLNCLNWTETNMVARMLETGVADAVIIPLHESDSIICNLTYPHWFYVELMDYRNAVFHYVHKKHQHLIPKIAVATAQTIEKGLMLETQNRWRQQIVNCGKSTTEL